MNKINFTNLPSTTTPVNATNLNTLQDNVEEGMNFRLTTGTEKATNEYIDGKQVYRKRISLGTFPNNTNKTVLHYISNPKFIRMVIMGDNGNGTYQDMSLRAPFECYVTGSAIVFNPRWQL